EPDDLPVDNRRPHDRQATPVDLRVVASVSRCRHGGDLVLLAVDRQDEIRTAAPDGDVMGHAVERELEGHAQFLHPPMAAYGSGVSRARSRKSLKPSAATVSTWARVRAGTGSGRNASRC